MELQQNYDVIRNMDTEIIAIAQEERDASTLSHTQRFVKNEYPIVADPKRESWKTFARYGVYIVDKQGVIRAFVPGTKEARPRLDLVLKQLAKVTGKKLPELEYARGTLSVKRKKSPHQRMRRGEDTVTARLMVSHPKIREGMAFKVAFLPTVVQGYHAYGFGEQQMTPFTVELALPPGIELAKPVEYPSPKVILDEVTKKKVRIYEGDIPMSAIELRATDKLRPGKLEIGITIRFQSCDDSACFPPTTKRFSTKLEAIKPVPGRLPGVAGWNRW